MSNKQNDILMNNILDEVEKIRFIWDSERLEYAQKWYQALLESEQGDIFKVKPPLYSIQPMTDEQLQSAEDKFINSFSE